MPLDSRFWPCSYALFGVIAHGCAAAPEPTAAGSDGAGSAGDDAHLASTGAPAGSSGQAVGGSTGPDDGDATSAGDTATDDPPQPSNFADRCAAPGVLRCVGFDDPQEIAGRWGDNSGILSGASTPEIDTDVRASGSGSLRFTIPEQSGADTSGAYFINFSDDLATQFGADSTFYVQWRQRSTREFIETQYAGGGGHKRAIIGLGDFPGCTPSNSLSIDSGGFCASSCTALEVVTTTYYDHGFASMYNSCTGSASHGPYDGFYEPFGAYDFKLQNARPAPFCLYSQDAGGFFPPSGNCSGDVADHWMTYQVEIATGPRQGDEWIDSHVRLWIADEGAASEIAIDWGPYALSAGDPALDFRFGKVWLTPYNTGKDPTVNYPVAYTWYDELIISSERIADPGES